VVFGEFPIVKIVQELAHDNLLPVIVFRSSRKQCDLDMERLAQARSGRLDPVTQERLIEEINRICERYTFDPLVVSEDPQFSVLVQFGAGAHHAGQLLVWRIVLEELMIRGMLRVMVATGTVAAGVDFPARSVIITAHSKRGNEGFKVLAASEFQQMSGRAGRRGKDAVGFCLVAPGPYCDARVVHDLARQPPEPLRSAYFAAPSTMLNLLKYRNVDDLRYTVQRSLAAFLDRKNASIGRQAAMLEQAVLEEEVNDGRSRLSGEPLKKAHKRIRRKIREADELDARQEQILNISLAGLETLGYVKAGGLTDKGVWAAELCTSLVLHLAEAIAEGIFKDLTVEELTAVVASIAGDSHRTYFSLKANPIKKEYFEKLSKIVERVQTSFHNQTAATVEVLPDAATTVLAWMDSESWSEFAGYLRLAGAAEGDVARLVSQTADHLNQITRLSDTFPELAAAAEEGRRRILRPPLTEAMALS